MAMATLTPDTPGTQPWPVPCCGCQRLLHATSAVRDGVACYSATYFCVPCGTGRTLCWPDEVVVPLPDPNAPDAPVTFTGWLMPAVPHPLAAGR
jgi:hypothetical protein